MFSFFRKKPIENTSDMLPMTHDEREIAAKYGLSFEDYLAMRKELSTAKTWGRPAGAKNKKRKKPNVVK
jgi:hypothetical protein